MDRYVDLIHQNFEFPTVEFKELKNELFFHDIPLMKLIKNTALHLESRIYQKSPSRSRKREGFLEML